MVRSFRLGVPDSSIILIIVVFECSKYREIRLSCIPFLYNLMINCFSMSVMLDCLPLFLFVVGSGGVGWVFLGLPRFFCSSIVIYSSCFSLALGHLYLLIPWISWSGYVLKLMLYSLSSYPVFLMTVLKPLPFSLSWLAFPCLPNSF